MSDVLAGEISGLLTKVRNLKNWFLMVKGFQDYMDWPRVELHIHPARTGQRIQLSLNPHPLGRCHNTGPWKVLCPAMNKVLLRVTEFCFLKGIFRQGSS